MPAHLEPFHERGFRFGCHIVRLYLEFAAMPRLPLHLARQVLRSGTSIGTNLQEAKGAQSRRDSAARFTVALKEARETAYWLRLLATTGLVPDSLIAPAQDEADQLVAILTVARRKLNAEAEGSKDPKHDGDG